ncbi:uncharacterized protein SPAPADRAFT_158592 [Spathaspora passalidarum NRRL Y-27907]|uniref:Uncharacterized protein n=1 Tax=Spathaspora passalidarum (strain NRRL Y-27907 / 11-Y1) TaxID=619300 RepID=G3AV50_SPAPN|nr:uncharacterized protein SPAPADRAFT_158592 [Spathaspora passalidarum NRRL Y-27907]EGW30124.1 hypothetical protein SPAPADRAFT_158592 [Spathaspora passalidarum NRRL Y-27907]
MIDFPRLEYLIQTKTPNASVHLHKTPSTDMINRKITILSGGTATNELVSLFKNLCPNDISYILPISDNGGSTSEIIRIIGGPAIGDIRSRLTRLIPPHQEPLRRLLGFRLSSEPKIAKIQWNEIVDGSHELWIDINPATREIFRAFFIHLHVELLKRSKLHSSKKQFRYELANVGNLFLTGARLFIGSLDSAIELFCKLADIDREVQVMPCINTNFTYHISALLENGLIITGQSQISHPSETHVHPHKKEDNYPPPIDHTRPSTPSENALMTSYFGTPSLGNVKREIPINEVATANQYICTSEEEEEDQEDEESGNVPQYTHPELKKSQLHFNKSENIQPLLSPIKRIFYISPYGEEIRPTADSKVVSTITNSDTVIYSIGSLMTSIVPIIILKGIGKAIATELPGKHKKRILLLNGCLDRETYGMSAVDFIKVIIQSALYSQGSTSNYQQVEWNKYITHLVYMKEGQIHVDAKYLQDKGINCVEVQRIPDTNYFHLDELQSVLNRII